MKNALLVLITFFLTTCILPEAYSQQVTPTENGKTLFRSFGANLKTTFSNSKLVDQGYTDMYGASLELHFKRSLDQRLSYGLSAEYLSSGSQIERDFDLPFEGKGTMKTFNYAFNLLATMRYDFDAKWIMPYGQIAAGIRNNSVKDELIFQSDGSNETTGDRRSINNNLTPVVSASLGAVIPIYKEIRLDVRYNLGYVSKIEHINLETEDRTNFMESKNNILHGFNVGLSFPMKQIR